MQKDNTSFTLLSVNNMMIALLQNYLFHRIWTLNGRDKRLLGSSFGDSILKKDILQKMWLILYLYLHLFVAQIKVIALTHWVDVCSVTKRFQSKYQCLIKCLFDNISVYNLDLLWKEFYPRLLVSSGAVGMSLSYL